MYTHMQRERKIHEIHIPGDHKDKVLSLRLWPHIILYRQRYTTDHMTCTDSLIFTAIYLFPSAANAVNISKHLGSSA